MTDAALREDDPILRRAVMRGDLVGLALVASAALWSFAPLFQ